VVTQAVSTHSDTGTVGTLTGPAVAVTVWESARAGEANARTTVHSDTLTTTLERHFDRLDLELDICSPFQGLPEYGRLRPRTGALQPAGGIRPASRSDLH
jgi:hypothetical protein